jgi:hypothetical protein
MIVACCVLPRLGEELDLFRALLENWPLPEGWLHCQLQFSKQPQCSLSFDLCALQLASSKNEGI